MVNAGRSRSRNGGSTRAGRYVAQPSGYRAFLPAPLPPRPAVRLPSLQKALSDADRALGRLDGSIQTLPNPDLFVYMYVRKEAVLSSQIEGTQSSLQDLLSVEAEPKRASTAGDVGELVGYVRAMNYGLRRLAKLPVCMRLIREIHAELLRGLRGAHLEPGELRRSQNWIGPGGCTLSEATFVPPPPTELPRGTGCFGEIPARGRPFAASRQDWARTCAVRDHPPVSRRQRESRSLADHVPLVRERCAQQACSLPIALLQAPPVRVLRPSARDPRSRRLRGMARSFSSAAWRR